MSGSAKNMNLLLLLIALIGFVLFVLPFIVFVTGITTTLHVFFDLTWLVSFGFALIPGFIASILFLVLGRTIAFKAYEKINDAQVGRGTLRFSLSRHTPYIVALLLLAFGLQYALVQYLRTGVMPGFAITIILGAASFMFGMKLFRSYKANR